VIVLVCLLAVFKRRGKDLDKFT